MKLSFFFVLSSLIISQTTPVLGAESKPQALLLYTANTAANSVSVVEVPKQKLLEQISVGADPGGVLPNSNGKYVYITNKESNSVSVIDTTAQKVIATIPVGTRPNHLYLSPDGKTVWVTQQEDLFGQPGVEYGFGHRYQNKPGCEDALGRKPLWLYHL